MQFLPRVLVRDIECILMRLEILGHRRRERTERGRNNRMLGEAFAARLLLVFAHASHDTPKRLNPQLPIPNSQREKIVFRRPGLFRPGNIGGANRLRTERFGGPP